MELKETFQKVKAASKTLGLLSDEQRNEILQAVADGAIAPSRHASYVRLYEQAKEVPEWELK